MDRIGLVCSDGNMRLLGAWLPGVLTVLYIFSFESCCLGAHLCVAQHDRNDGGLEEPSCRLRGVCRMRCTTRYRSESGSGVVFGSGAKG